MSFIRSIILSSILSVFGTAFSPLIAQQNTFDCNVLWDKLQASNRFTGNDVYRSENYFFQEYCGCLQATGDTAKLNQFRYVTTFSAFSGGYAFKNTFWYGAIVDTNFKEISKTNNFEARYIGYGYYLETQFGQVVLMDPFGKKVATPKQYEIIDAMSSTTTGKIIFIGRTGLTCDAFTVDGMILKTWEGIYSMAVLSDHLLLLNKYTEPKLNFEKDKKSIYSSDLEEILPFTAIDIYFTNNRYVFITENREAVVLDEVGKLLSRQAEVQNFEKNNELKMLASIDGKWLQYDLEKGAFDSLIPNQYLNSLGYSIQAHPKNISGVLIRNSKLQPAFAEPVTWMEQMNDNWIGIYAGSESILWNPRTGEKIKAPKTYAEAKALNSGGTNKTDYTIFPFFYKSVRNGEVKKRVNSNNLTIYESYTYDAAGNQKNLIRQDYRWNITNAHLVVKNGYCFNYNAQNQLVDSFPADVVYELHQSNLLNFKDHPEFFPLAYSWNGKKGLFYLGNSRRTPAVYEEIQSNNNRVFRIKVRDNGKVGVIDANGKTIVPIAYSSIDFDDLGNSRATLENEEGRSKISHYFAPPPYLSVIDSSFQFVPSLDHQLLIKTNSSDKMGTYYDLLRRTSKVQLNQTYIPLQKGFHMLTNGADYDYMQLVDAKFKPLLDAKIYEYCELPNGIYIRNNASSEYDAFYSFEKKALKRLDLNIRFDDRGANQLIGEKEGQYYIINADGSQVKLPQGYQYKITNHSGLVYYSLLDNSKLWGLMKTDGTKVTEMLFRSVFKFNGEHGVVWVNSERFYIDSMGKTLPF